MAWGSVVRERSLTTVRWVGEESYGVGEINAAGLKL